MLVALRSRRQIAPFKMLKPATADEALAMHAEPGRNVFMAGGIELIDWLKYGHQVDRVIRLDGISSIRTMTMADNALRIGAMTTHDAITAAPLSDLAGLWPQVANPRVRFTGTIGGNVMCGKSDYDGLPALLALGARAEMASGATVGLDALDCEPLVAAFVIPAPTTLRLFADRSLRPAMTLWFGLSVSSGTVSQLRVAVGGAHPKPVCVAVPLDLKLSQLGAQAAVIADQVAADLPEPVTDGRASAAYRRRMTAVLTRRILIRAGDSV